jgi:hypothetical protein
VPEKQQNFLKCINILKNLFIFIFWVLYFELAEQESVKENWFPDSIICTLNLQGKSG